MSNAAQFRDAPDNWKFAGEYITDEAPFTVRRAVRWADCDPAGVVYLGNFPHYLLSAVHLFRNRSLGVGWIDSAGEQGFQTPGKALAMVFQGPLWPDDVFDMAVYVGDVRKHTMDVLVQATRADNRENVFAGRMTSIFVTAADRRKTIEIPQATRDLLEGYRARNRPPPAIAEALRAPG